MARRSTRLTTEGIASRRINAISQNMRRPIRMVSADYTLTNADVGSLFVVSGATATVTFYLPSVIGRSGHWCEFYNATTDQTMRIETVHGNELIGTNRPTVNWVEFSTTNQQCGGGVRVICDGQQWMLSGYFADETQTLSYDTTTVARAVLSDACTGLITSAAQTVYDAVGVIPCYRITQSYWQSGVSASFIDGPGTYETFSGSILAARLLNGTGGGCETGNLEPIPASWTGLISIDIEEPYELPLVQDLAAAPVYSDDDAQLMADLYIDVIQGVKTHAPGATVSLYNMTRSGPNNVGVHIVARWAMLEAMHAEADAMDITLWRRGNRSFDEDETSRTRVILDAFEMQTLVSTPIYVWVRHDYNPNGAFGFGEIGYAAHLTWCNNWSEFDIAGFICYDAEDDAVTPQVTTDSLAQSEITRPP